MESNDAYNQDYRHFDNLIWQVPAWASAIFSFSITASVLALANRVSIEKTLPVDGMLAVAVFLFSVFFVFLLMMNVFLRFRLHQRPIYRPNRKSVPSCWFMIPGQTSLLLILFIEAGVILCFSFIAFGMKPLYAYMIGALFLFLGFLYVESVVRRLSEAMRSQRKPAEPNVNDFV